VAERAHHAGPPAALEPTERRVSRVLTEARTVHKRAVTALATIREPLRYQPTADRRDTEYHVEHHYGEHGRTTGSDTWSWRDPDADAIEAALEAVVALLAPFERGAKIKAKCSGCGEQYALTARGNITAHPDKVFYTAQCGGVGRKPARG
jgi:hypothetical protein